MLYCFAPSVRMFTQVGSASTLCRYTVPSEYFSKVTVNRMPSSV